MKNEQQFDNAEDERLLKALQTAFQSSEENYECDYSDKAIAFALNELEPEEYQKIREHILTCRSCLNLIFDIRQTEINAEQSEDKQAEIHPATLEETEKPEKSYISFFKNMLDFISNLFSSFSTLKIVSAATACMLMFITFYHIYNRPVLISADMVIIAKPLITRGQTRVEDRPDEFIVQEGKSLEIGDTFSIRVKAGQNAFGYVILHDSGTNEILKLYEGDIPADKEFIVKSGIQVRGEKGINTVYLIASDKPIKDYHKKFDELKIKGIANISDIFSGISIYKVRFKYE